VDAAGRHWAKGVFPSFNSHAHAEVSPNPIMRLTHCTIARTGPKSRRRKWETAPGADELGGTDACDRVDVPVDGGGAVDGAVEEQRAQVRAHEARNLPSTGKAKTQPCTATIKSTESSQAP